MNLDTAFVSSFPILTFSGISHESWQDSFRPSDGVCAVDQFCTNRRSLGGFLGNPDSPGQQALCRRTAWTGCEHRRQCLCAGYLALGSWGFLHHGSGLYGLCSAVHDASGWSLLRHPRQIQFQRSTRVFGHRGQDYRRGVRSVGGAQWSITCVAITPSSCAGCDSKIQRRERL